MSEEMHGAFRPSPSCSLCRLGTLTVPTTPGDVRGRELTKLELSTAIHSSRWVKPHRSNVVQGDGPVPCPIMLIGEAPGQQEDRDGLGFRPSAPAGRVLKNVLMEVGLCRNLTGTEGPFYCEFHSHSAMESGFPSDYFPVYITNALKCRPVDNKIDRFLDCLELCRSTFLVKEIEAVNPKVIVLLGKVAAQPAFGKEKALALRQIEDVLVIHAPHPSTIARGNSDARPKLVEALRLAKEVGYESA